MGPGVRTHRNVLSSTAPLEGAFCFLTNTRRKASRRSCAGHVADDSGRSRRLLAAATVIQQTTSAPRQLQPAAARPSIARENTGPGRHLGEKKKKKREWRRRRRPDSLLSQSLFFLLIVLCFHRHFFTSTNFSAFSFLAFWCSCRLLAAMKSSSARNRKRCRLLRFDTTFLAFFLFLSTCACFTLQVLPYATEGISYLLYPM